MQAGHCRVTVVRAVVLAGFLCQVAGGCAGEQTDHGPQARGPIVLLGVDGLEWDVVLPLRADGRLPHLSALMARGVAGELETLTPTLSPVVWTTVATGKSSAKHGIPHFASQRPDGTTRLFTNTDRRTKALWNVLSDHGRRVAVVGWWMTYPVEPVNGVMVAQTNTTAQIDTSAGRQVWKGTLIEGVPDQVYPPERQAEMLAVLEELDADLSQLTARIFGEETVPRTELGRRLWNNCLWAFRADATYARIALALAREAPPFDLLLVYLGGPDVVGHRFWRYMRPDLYRHPPAPEEAASLGGVIEDYYVYVDEILGQLVEAAGPSATIMVVSDHGMKPVNRETRFDPDAPPADINSGHHLDAPPGVFVAAGPLIPPMASGTHTPSSPVAHAEIIRIGSVLDVTPTILAMLGIPVGLDMDGVVLWDLLGEGSRAAQPPAVATHDTPEFLAARAGGPAPRDPGERERVEQLRSLGYLP
jgi:hypothetical protein